MEPTKHSTDQIRQSEKLLSKQRNIKLKLLSGKAIIILLLLIITITTTSFKLISVFVADGTNKAVELEKGFERDPRPTLENALKSNKEYSTFYQLILQADITNMLSIRAQKTMIVPTNEAFNNMNQANLKELKKPKNRVKLANFLTYHIINSKIDDTTQNMSYDTVNGALVTITKKGSRLFITDLAGRTSSITKQPADIKNGGIYSIGTVLLVGK